MNKERSKKAPTRLSAISFLKVLMPKISKTGRKLPGIFKRRERHSANSSFNRNVVRGPGKM